MDFSLSKEQTMIRDMVREFAQAEIAPKAAAIDREARFPQETFVQM
ncbi:MAG: acyl-CoA dehydrogenase family protein, partial [Firmicutes bacterium]|nr:acyl-CoA dehydrogenase family protein [Bacillota bacterium]